MARKQVKVIIGVLIVFLGLLFYCRYYQQRTPFSSSTRIHSTPTLFLHGWGSSVNAEKQMTSAAQRAGVTNSVTQALVDRQGYVHLKGHISVQAHNPIIEVGFIDNRNLNYHQDGRWLKQVIIKLQQKYQIQNINLVGHSMGNMAISYYLLDNANNQKLPKLHKQVAIAGHFDGIIGAGDRPHRLHLSATGRPNYLDNNYKTLMFLRQRYPYKQVKILNIFGDKNDGTNSDGDVTNASAQSLRYLVQERALSYQERKIIGPDGQHSRLHESRRVDWLLINFLWNKTLKNRKS